MKTYKEFYHNALLKDVVPFWEKSDLIDKEYGGFISSVDREGKSYNDDKSVWFQGKYLWTFSKLCNTYGAKKEWAEASGEIYKMPVTVKEAFEKPDTDFSARKDESPEPVYRKNEQFH